MTAQYAALEQDSLPGPAGCRGKLEAFFSSWFSRVFIFCMLLTATLLLFWAMLPYATTGEAAKRGAGLLFVCAPSFGSKAPA